jgi:hypothetical protein
LPGDDILAQFEACVSCRSGHALEELVG